MHQPAINEPALAANVMRSFFDLSNLLDRLRLMFSRMLKRTRFQKINAIYNYALSFA